MSGSDLHPVEVAAVARAAAGHALDYYLVSSGAAQVDGIVVEEFVLADDCTAVGLDSAGWSASDGEWWSSAAFARAMRTDPALRGRITAISRADAGTVYRRLGGGELPGEAELRRRFQDRLPLAGSPPLLLTSPQVPEGFHDKRVYRLLFSGDLSADGVTRLLALWGMTLAGDAADPRCRVVGTARRPVLRNVFSWDLRRIGPGTAWCLDVTACLAGPSVDALRGLLRDLTAAMRQEGLIPVTIERFS